MDMLDVLKNREFDTVVLIEKANEAHKALKKQCLIPETQAMKLYKIRLLNRLSEIRRKMRIFHN